MKIRLMPGGVKSVPLFRANPAIHRRPQRYPALASCVGRRLASARGHDVSVGSKCRPMLSPTREPEAFTDSFAPFRRKDDLLNLIRAALPILKAIALRFQQDRVAQGVQLGLQDSFLYQRRDFQTLWFPKPSLI